MSKHYDLQRHSHPYVTLLNDTAFSLLNKNPNRALSLYKEALRIEPENPAALFYLGEFYSQNNSPDQALDYYKRLADANIVNSQYAHAYFIVGEYYYNKQEYLQAIPPFRKALIKRDFSKAYLYLGLSYAHLNNWLEVKKQILSLHFYGKSEDKKILQETLTEHLGAPLDIYYGLDFNSL